MAALNAPQSNVGSQITVALSDGGTKITVTDEAGNSWALGVNDTVHVKTWQAATVTRTADLA